MILWGSPRPETALGEMNFHLGRVSLDNEEIDSFCWRIESNFCTSSFYKFSAAFSLEPLSDQNSYGDSRQHIHVQIITELMLSVDAKLLARYVWPAFSIKQMELCIASHIDGQMWLKLCQRF